MSGKQVKAPISAHPLFPAVVAVWFAALFGLGSGVLPNILFEKLISATGIASQIPSATPPLGATFRIILSLTFAVFGAIMGFVLARRLAAAQYVERPASPVSRLTPRADPAPKSDGKRRPISVKDELGDTRLDPIVDEDEDGRSLPIPGRRRSLAMAEDERKSDFFTDAPVAVAETPAPEPAILPQEPPMEQPLDLTSFVSPEPVEDPVYVPQAEPRIEPESIVERGLHGLRNRSPFAKPFGDENEPPVNAAPPFTAPVVEQAPLDEAPLPFAAPSQAEPEPEQFFEPAAESNAMPANPPKQVFAAAAEVSHSVLPTDPGADLSDLGMVQLAERLAASLRERLSRPAATPAFVAGLKADFGIESAADEALATIAPGSAIFGHAAFDPVAPDAPPPPPVIPAGLRPLSLDFDDEDDDLVPLLSLPLAGPAPAGPPAEEDEIEEPGEAEENYSSLLAMKNPFRAPAEFVRIDEPEHDAPIEPAVVFPGETPGAASNQQSFVAPDAPPVPGQPEPRPFDAPGAAAVQRDRPNSEETERALRSALATLQRMSGAA